MHWRASRRHASSEVTTTVLANAYAAFTSPENVRIRGSAVNPTHLSPVQGRSPLPVEMLRAIGPTTSLRYGSISFASAQASHKCGLTTLGEGEERP